MRKPKGKLVALLAGAVVVVLVAVGAWFWRDFYCHLFLDHRLVGRWNSEAHLFKFVTFDKVGNVQSESLKQTTTGTYLVAGDSLIITWPDEAEPNEMTYRVAGDSLTIERPGVHSVLRRVPDDS